jgi:hypothetical protein
MLHLQAVFVFGNGIGNGIFNFTLSIWGND